MNDDDDGEAVPLNAAAGRIIEEQVVEGDVVRA